jgi:hypothetical protein
MIVERSYDLEASQNAENAIEFPACRLGVEVASENHGVKRIFLPWPPGKDIAHPIDRNRAAGVLAPGYEEIAPLPVEIGQSEAVASALGCRTDLRHLHDAVPETCLIYLDIALHSYSIPTPAITKLTRGEVP